MDNFFQDTSGMGICDFYKSGATQCYAYILMQKKEVDKLPPLQCSHPFPTLVHAKGRVIPPKHPDTLRARMVEGQQCAEAVVSSKQHPDIDQ
jgi:hypothetical protein